MRWVPFVALLLVFGMMAGCQRPTSRVHGTVKYRGKPLTEGAVVFMIDNMTYPADIRPDGTYEAVNVPRGKVAVVVQVQTPRPPSRAIPNVTKDAAGREEASNDDRAKMSRLPEAPPPTGKRVDTQIPEKYGSPTTSGLSIELTQPNQEYNIDLE